MPRARRLLTWSAALALAIVVGLFATPPAPPPGAAIGRVFPRMASPAPDFPTLLYFLGVGSVVWFMGIVALPALVWGARHVGAQENRRRVVVLSAVAVLVLFALSSVVQFVMIYNGAPSRPPFAAYLPMALRQNLLPWIALVGVVAALEARRRARASLVEHARLRAEVAEQRLIALTGQLQPHFLFNTLQGISTLIHRDANAADEMLGKLSDLLRELLRHRDRVLVSLADELRYARTYLEIAELRFADRLSFEIRVPEDLHGASVPLFILQPLVENALAHGIGARAEGGAILIRARRQEGRLVLEVRDDGAGLPVNRTPDDGVGLGNTRERLRATFGDDQSLVLEALPGGTVARVEMPYRQHTS
jgi:two-component sensor histidine kinase